MKHTAKTSQVMEYNGPLDWRTLVQWLLDDGVISGAEAERTVARCASAHSAQHPLQRLSVVAMARQADSHVLDVELLTQWLAKRSGLDYMRIDPLKVDVGKVADVMSAAYAERHKVLPVQVSPTGEHLATALGGRAGVGAGAAALAGPIWIASALYQHFWKKRRNRR